MGEKWLREENWSNRGHTVSRRICPFRAMLLTIMPQHHAGCGVGNTNVSKTWSLSFFMLAAPWTTSSPHTCNVAYIVPIYFLYRASRCMLLIYFICLTATFEVAFTLWLAFHSSKELFWEILRSRYQFYLNCYRT